MHAHWVGRYIRPLSLAEVTITYTLTLEDGTPVKSDGPINIVCTHLIREGSIDENQFNIFNLMRVLTRSSQIVDDEDVVPGIDDLVKSMRKGEEATFTVCVSWHGFSQ